MIEKLRWLLLAFEGISGLKVNFAKSEMVPINLTTQESDCLANI